ncbi:hypothetical protein [Microbulbifer pacificus]|uniref:SnoaL-like domain-containing protein n=1 Tax=Microbulbifer pacificus TaxID=407164 RepID=A0AAU0MYH3_9GAMM|nr:hypothetical protein [Microbulbifer pacificus]WOX05066.1 hypothetical protein R5R33_15155 [Microbulbifer pacificus]
MKIRTIMAVLVMALSSAAIAKEEEKSANQEINEVIEAFHLSIIEKDEEKFHDLFYDKSIPWISVVPDKRTGSLPSQLGVQPGSYMQFISWIVATKEKTEEKFWDVEIITDKEIASVHFKYSFHIDDYKSNWGDEAWHLLKTADGWKISSVIYSYTRNPEPKPKKI